MENKLENKSAKNTKKKLASGAEAVAYAMKQINPDVVAAYPITPQTYIMEKFSEYVADGTVDTEFVNVESEHSALSACVGASAAGARAMTASSSAGLAYMFEILGVASGLRLPIIMNIVNRALSAPINIHCDHSDSMACRDSGWIQIYSESAQEAYENTILAVRLAESVNLPIMVMQDGFIVSHGIENINFTSDSIVKGFIGEFKPKISLFDFKNPKTIGALQLPDYNFETKFQIARAMQEAKKKYLETGKELEKITGSSYGYFEYYGKQDAETVIVCLSSTAGTIKSMIDDGEDIALLKIKLFRPFAYDEIREILKHKEKVIVLDRSESYGAYPPLYSEIRNSLFGHENKPNNKPKTESYVFGIGGRDIYKKQLKDVIDGKNKTGYIGIRE